MCLKQKRDVEGTGVVETAESIVKTERELVDEYIKQFIDDFDSSIKINEATFPLISRLYIEVLDEYSNSNIYRKTLKEIAKLEDEFYSKCDNKELTVLFNKTDELRNLLQTDNSLQMFICGFCSAKELEEEQLKKKIPIMLNETY